MSFLRSLLADHKGTSAIEFALIAPPLLFMVVGIADLGRGIARKFELDQAAYRAVELTAVGTPPGGYIETLKAEAKAASGEPDGHIQVFNWRECDGAVQETFDGNCAANQQVALFVRVTIFSDFEPTFSYGPFGSAFGGDRNGKVRLRSQATVRVQ